MTTRFRLDAVILDTTEGEVRYTFPSDLTVLAGPSGVGKTTLLEMVKHGFGGKGVLAPVAVQSVNDVILDVTIGASRYRLARSIDRTKGKTVRVTDLITQERLPDHHVDNQQPNLSSILLTALGLPDDLKAAARSGTSSKAGDRITFADVFSYLYIPQSDINRDIANSQESYRNPKRKAVFELLFGITTPEILAMHSRVNTLKGEITEAENSHRIVLDFLRASGTTSRIQAEQALAAALDGQRQAEVERDALRDAIDPVTDRETQTLRDLLAEAERSLAEAQAAVIQLIRQQAEYTGERRRVQSDLARLARMRDAGERLASIEFSVCPRCTQSLTHRNVPHGSCRVCLQPDSVTEGRNTDPYEARQLTDQLAEMDDQLRAITKQLDATTQAVTEREGLVTGLIAELEARTAARVTPRLQAFSDVTDRLATARAQQQQLQDVLRQWDQVDDIQAASERLRTERERLKADIARTEAQLDARRREVLDSLTEEFQNAATAIGIPGVQNAAIHESSYLPLLDGQPFDKVSSAGGILTITQVAYWTSLLNVALRLRDTLYPTFLLIDSPRLALNEEEELTEAIYRRLVTQADASPGRLQFIIADNNLPATYRRDYAEIDFSYDHPTVSTVHHPGRAAVELIAGPDDGSIPQR